MISSVFKRGQRIVWRMELVDTSTGKIMQATDVKSVILKLTNGENVNFRYGRHGATEDAPWFWTTTWDIPPDYSLGVIDYAIEVTPVAGKAVAFKQPLMATATSSGRSVDPRFLLTIVE